MFVLEVIPFSRTAPQAPLSYRSRADLPVGTLVSIPLRKKTLPGLVIGSVPVREAKSILKTASFTLSKSSSVTLGTLPTELIEAAKKIATYHATSLGAVLSSLLIPILPSDDTLEIFDTNTSYTFEGTKHKIERIEAPFVDRHIAYKKYSESGTTLLVVPTQTEADEWAVLLKDLKPLVLSGKITGKRREAALARIPTISSSIPSLVITTPGFSFAPIPHLSRIIIERMSAGSYSLPKRPYLDIRYALCELARTRSIPVIYGDYPLPLEYRKDPTAKIEKVSPGQIEVMDVRTDKSEVKKSEGQWQALSEPIRNEIRDTLEKDGRVAILAVRRGYSPTVVCKDCGTTVTDEHGRTLSLATIKGVRAYRANDGTVTNAAEVFCKVCGGWNLMPLGIGIERIEEELRSAFPKNTIVRIDQDTKSVSSLRKAREEITQPGVIIIGTEIMLPFLSPYDPVDLGIIASADTLLALPFWRARERFVRIGRMLAERAEHTLIATRHPEDAALNSLTNPNDTTFWTEETSLRKILSYPPFGTLIVFHIEGTAARLEEARALIRSASLPHTPHALPDQPIPASAGNFKSSLVLMLPSGIWPSKDLSQKLANLSPAIRINIDSEMLW